MKKLTTMAKVLIRDEEGATAVEYAIMVAAIAAVVVGIVISIGTKSNTAFSKADTALGTLPGGS